MTDMAKLIESLHATGTVFSIPFFGVHKSRIVTEDGTEYYFINEHYANLQEYLTCKPIKMDPQFEKRMKKREQAKKEKQLKEEKKNATDK